MCGYVNKLRNMFRLRVTGHFLDSHRFYSCFIDMKFQFNIVNIEYERCCSITVADWILAPFCRKIPTLHQNCVWIYLSFHGLNELKTTANRLTIKIQLKWMYVVHRWLNTEHAFHFPIYSILYILHTFSIGSRKSHFAFSFTLTKVFIVFVERVNGLILMNYPQSTLL